MKSDLEIKALQSLQWVVDVCPQGARGSAKVFHDEMVAYHLLNRKLVKLVYLLGECKVVPTQKGLDALKENQPRIGNA